MPSESDEQRVEATAEALATETTHTAEDLAAETARKATVLADALTDALGKVTGQLQSQGVYGKRNRQIIIALVISFAVDIVITVVLGIFAVKTNNTADTLHHQAYQACLNSNVTKAGIIRVWEDNIATFHDNAKGAAFLKLVHAVYAPLNCKGLR